MNRVALVAVAALLAGCGMFCDHAEDATQLRRGFAEMEHYWSVAAVRSLTPEEEAEGTDTRAQLDRHLRALGGK